jgi:hypothetical protein
MQVDAREFDQRKRKFREFLNENNEHYMGKIRDSIDNDKFRSAPAWMKHATSDQTRGRTINFARE